MPTQLTAAQVKGALEPGRYSDQNGLALQVQRGRDGMLKKSWVVRFSLAGKRREMGLGPTSSLTLKDARAKAIEIKRDVASGVDPIAEKKRRADELQSKPVEDSFAECARAYIAGHEVSWKNPKHRQQWRNTLETYAFPVIGDLHPRDITTDHVLAVLKPIWATKTETASRLRGRIEVILSWAAVRGLTSGPNPALWRGHLDVLLPKKSKIAPVTHHGALPYQDLPSFLVALRNRRAPAACALEFTILTAARSGEVRGMTWDEVDLDQKVWTVPPGRMKTGTEHRVPLSCGAMTILNGLQRSLVSNLVFPSQTGTTPYSDAVYRALFARMGFEAITAHGFRSTFRDWCGEETDYPRELAEHALSHSVGNRVELAYRRGDALQKRRVLMEDWSSFALSLR